MKPGNKVSTPDGEQGYINNKDNDKFLVSFLSKRGQPVSKRFSEKEITIDENHAPMIGDYTPYGTVTGMKLLFRDIDGMFEVTCVEPDKTNNVLWVEDKFHEKYDTHLNTKNSSMKELRHANWIGHDHFEKFLAYYGIERKNNGKYLHVDISHNENPIKTRLSVVYRDSTNENERLVVTMNDRGKIMSIKNNKDGKYLLSVFDLRMADIVEATFISEHKLTDF